MDFAPKHYAFAVRYRLDDGRVALCVLPVEPLPPLRRDEVEVADDFVRTDDEDGANVICQFRATRSGIGGGVRIEPRLPVLRGGRDFVRMVKDDTAARRGGIV